MMLGWLFILAAQALWRQTDAGPPDTDVTELGLLPLDRLLALKRALTPSAQTPADSQNDMTGPVQLALRGDPARLRPIQPSRRGGGPSIWVEEVDVWKGGGGHWKGGKGKLEAIFQGTVTTLAFLAFGGYLLALILNAFRTTAPLTMTLVTTAVPAAKEGRAVAEEDMYQTLTGLAEGYARYNQHCLRESCH